MSVLEPTEYRTSASCPLLKFASAYNDSLHNHEESLPFEATRKDGYTTNLIAPDHLITGLFKGVLFIVFMQLENDDARLKLQVCLKESLAKFGFQSQSKLYKMKKQKLEPGLSMSLLYAILTILPSTLESLNLLEELPSKRILMNLHRFFAVSFWWPSLNHDGRRAWDFVHGSRIDSYHRVVQILASNFV